MKRRAGLLCTLWLLMVAGGTAPLGAQAPGLVPVIVLEEEMPRRIILNDSLLIYWDSSGRSDVETILGLPETEFGRPPQSAAGSTPFVVWAKLKVKNNSPSTCCPPVFSKIKNATLAGVSDAMRIISRSLTCESCDVWCR